ncbi:MAG: cation transporter [Lachnospiraceae bacterium]|nr:cation transporter [Lachnospiraceae bacterium]
MKKTYILEDLDCAHCAAKIETAVSRLDGVEKCTVTFLTQKLVIEAEEEKIPQITKEIKSIVKKTEPDVTVIEK